MYPTNLQYGRQQVFKMIWIPRFRCIYINRLLRLGFIGIIWKFELFSDVYCFGYDAWMQPCCLSGSRERINWFSFLIVRKTRLEINLINRTDVFTKRKINSPRVKRKIDRRKWLEKQLIMYRSVLRNVSLNRINSAVRSQCGMLGERTSSM